jgi:hypothetical protein
MYFIVFESVAERRRELRALIEGELRGCFSGAHTFSFPESCADVLLYVEGAKDQLVRTVVISSAFFHGDDLDLTPVFLSGQIRKVHPLAWFFIYTTWPQRVEESELFDGFIPKPEQNDVISYEFLLRFLLVIAQTRELGALKRRLPWLAKP